MEAATLTTLHCPLHPQSCFAVVLGGPEETGRLLEHKFDYILFTGEKALALEQGAQQTAGQGGLWREGLWPWVRPGPWELPCGIGSLKDRKAKGRCQLPPPHMPQLRGIPLPCPQGALVWARLS